MFAFFPELPSLLQIKDVAETLLHLPNNKMFAFFPELPSLLQIKDVAETLLHLPNGGWLLCRLVANSPDSFKEGSSHHDNNSPIFRYSSKLSPLDNFQ